MRRSQNILTLLRIQFESANKNNILAVTRATRDVIQKGPRSSGDENVSTVFRGLLSEGPIGLKTHWYLP